MVDIHVAHRQQRQRNLNDLIQDVTCSHYSGSGGRGHNFGAGQMQIKLKFF